jgi:ubiquinone/menaquinone biosynthesis C-methylase UbiE
MYVCPKCKGNLVSLRCETCGLAFPEVKGVPLLLSDQSEGSESQTLRRVYDEIYSHHEDVWVDQGRSSDFRSYFSSLTACGPTETVLEIGCGEGLLLAELGGGVKYGIDPSVHALLRAAGRTSSSYAVARAEELPFPSRSFDVVVTVGVMEHFQDVETATAEIYRVLKPSGRYIALIHTDMTALQRVKLKTRQYLFPRPKLIEFGKWLKKKLSKTRIIQPYRKSYTIESATGYLKSSGLQVTRVITRKSNPGIPLAGNHVVILFSTRPS